jgi:ACS family hexuronate transporter-like MFS transporter
MPPPYAQEVRPAHSKYRWVILGLLFLATTINYVHRLVMSILGPDLQVKYHISDISYGKIQAAFALAYALGQLGAGAWLEWLGMRVGYAIALGAWSLASMFHAVMRTTVGFGFARALLGAAESPNYPACVKTIAEWFPRRERAFAMGFVNAGCNVGAIVAPLAVPWLALHWGWQWAFVATGAVGLIWVVLWLPLYRRPAEHPEVSAEELALINSDPPEPVTKVPWRTLLLYRQTWAFAIGKFLSDPIWWFYMTWVPKFLTDRRHLDLKTIGLPLVAVYLMADVGSIAGGWLSSTLIKQGWSVTAARKTAMLICVLCVLPVMAASRVTSLWAAVALVGLGTAAHQGWSSNLYTMVSDVFPRRTVGSVAGLGGMFGYIGAFFFSWLTGHLLDWTHNNYTLIFVIASASYLVALTAVQLCAPSLEPLVIQETRGFPVTA